MQTAQRAEQHVEDNMLKQQASLTPVNMAEHGQEHQIRRRLVSLLLFALGLT